MVGGVALNCVANGKLVRTGMLKDIRNQLASGDAGGGVGAVFAGCHTYLDNTREAAGRDLQRGALLGPEFGGDSLSISLTIGYYKRG